MTIMYCQKCHSLAECRVESPQPTHRTVYFEKPYMNAYVRLRTCDNCGGQFKTYELGEKSFKTLRKLTEMSRVAGELIKKTWAATREEFNARREGSGLLSPEEKRLQEKMEHQKSELGPNVISLFTYHGKSKDDAPAE